MDFVTYGQLILVWGFLQQTWKRYGSDTDSIFYRKTILQNLSRPNSCQNMNRQNGGRMVAAIAGDWFFAAICASPVMAHTDLKVG